MGYGTASSNPHAAGSAGSAPTTSTGGSSVTSIVWKRIITSSSISRRWQITSLTDQSAGVAAFDGSNAEPQVFAICVS